MPEKERRIDERVFKIAETARNKTVLHVFGMVCVVFFFYKSFDYEKVNKRGSYTTSEKTEW